MRADSFKDFVLDQLGQDRELICRPMFGGYGLYHRALFFGIIHKGRFYLKTNGHTRAAYASRGMQPFRPNGRQLLKHYFEVPIDILEDAEALRLWARLAVEPPNPQLRLPFLDLPPSHGLLAPA